MKTLSTRLDPITRVQIARYAGATRDFNLIHVDEVFAREQAKLPSVVAHGPLVVSLVLDQVVAAIGSRSIGRLACRLRSPVFPGDVLIVSLDAGGNLSVAREDGSVVLTGEIELRSNPT